MGTRVAGGSSLFVLLLVLLACRLPGSAKEEAAASGTVAATAAPAPAPASPPSAAPTPVAAPSAAPAASTAPGKDYATTGIKAAPPDCKEAWAILTTVPAALHDKPEFFWRFARQVFFANQFGYGIPEAPGSVVFHEGPHTPTGGFALGARCSNGAECNQVAAAYKTVVPTSKPEVVCGKLPDTTQLGPGAGVFEWDLTPGKGLHRPLEKNLPAKDDAVSQCVRLAACKAARDRKLDGDPAIECQKKPSNFKIACALKSTCADVLACTGE